MPTSMTLSVRYFVSALKRYNRQMGHEGGQYLNGVAIKAVVGAIRAYDAHGVSLSSATFFCGL